jgi:hypothetical protein
MRIGFVNFNFLRQGLHATNEQICIKIQFVPHREHNPCQRQPIDHSSYEKIGIYCAIAKQHVHSGESAKVLNAAAGNIELNVFQKVTKSA